MPSVDASFSPSVFATTPEGDLRSSSFLRGIARTSSALRSLRASVGNFARSISKAAAVPNTLPLSTTTPTPASRDFLSYLTLKRAERLRIDAVVLNSVVNVGKAMPFLQRHRVVHTFFDNDEAGRRATAQVQQLAPAVEVVDQAPLYRDHNDLNEYLQARIRTQQERQRPAVKMAPDKGPKLGR